MARLTEAATPDDMEAESAAPAHAPRPPAAQAEALVREVHSLLKQPIFAPHNVNRLPLTHNPGVGSKTSRSNKRLRSECLQDAAKQWPHLIRQELETVGGKIKFQRRMCDVSLMDQVLGNLASPPSETFGDWTAWTWPSQPTGESAWDNFYAGLDLRCPPNKKIKHVFCSPNLYLSARPRAARFPECRTWMGSDLPHRYGAPGTLRLLGV